MEDGTERGREEEMRWRDAEEQRLRWRLGWGSGLRRFTETELFNADVKEAYDSCSTPSDTATHTLHVCVTRHTDSMLKCTPTCLSSLDCSLLELWACVCVIVCVTERERENVSVLKSGICLNDLIGSVQVSLDLRHTSPPPLPTWTLTLCVI